MKKNTLIVFLISVFGMVSCFKAPSYPVEPYLEFNKFQIANPVYTLGDTGTLLLNFTDGDGDIGILDGDSSIVSYINTKPDTFFRQVYYNIPYVPQKGTSDAISGTIEIKLNNALFSAYEFYFSTRGKTIDTFSYKMKIIDRAGHISNEITTPPIVVKIP